MHGELTDLSDLMGLLDVALPLVVPARFAREVRASRHMRTVIDFLSLSGPSMSYQIAKPFHLDEEDIYVAATWLKSRGFLTGSMVNEQDPGYTWTITPRGRRLHDMLYK
jgi:hypothetical protein